MHFKTVLIFALSYCYVYKIHRFYLLFQNFGSLYIIRRIKLFAEKCLHLSDPIFNLNNGYFEQPIIRNCLVVLKHFWVRTSILMCPVIQQVLLCPRVQRLYLLQRR